MEVKLWDFKTNKVTEIKSGIAKDPFSTCLLWLGSPGMGHGASSSEGKTKELKGTDGREDPEPNQAGGLIVGAPALWAPTGGTGRLDTYPYQPKDTMLRLECTSSEQLWTTPSISPAGLCHLLSGLHWSTYSATRLIACLTPP